MSLFSGDTQFGRVHSTKTSVSGAPPGQKRTAWLWNKPAIERLQWDKAQLCSAFVGETEKAFADIHQTSNRFNKVFKLLKVKKKK